MSFKSKIIIGFIAIQLVIIASLTFGGMQSVERFANYSLERKAIDVSKILQPIGLVGITREDLRWFEKTAKLVLLSDDIQAVQLADVDGKVLIDENMGKEGGFLYQTNINKDQQVYGQLTVKLTNQAASGVTAETQQIILYTGIAIAVLALLIGIFFVNMLLRNYALKEMIASESEYVADVEFVAPVQELPVEQKVVSKSTFETPVSEPVSEQVYEAPVKEEKDPNVLEFEVVEFATEESAVVEVVEKNKFFPEIVNNSPDAIISIDLTGRITEFNLAAEKLFGFNRNDILGKDISETLLLNQDVERYKNFLNEIAKGTGQTPADLFESQFRSAENKIVEARTYLTTVVAETGTQIVIFARDISQQKATENRLNYLAFNDELTDLPNLSLLSDHIRKATFEADKNNRQLVILKLGLDRFKHVNESLGHRFGDYLIRLIAARLKENIRRGDMVSRINGDQFVIAMVDVDYESNIDTLVQKYLDCFIEPFQVESNVIHTNVSIGATLYPVDEKSVDGLLRNAESAMFRAKDKGGNNYQFFSKEMREISQERLYMENQLRHALEQDQFELHYQPQVNLTTGKIIGVEALIRWNHPEMGLVPPLKFIPLAEETGLIVPIGEWVLREACTHNNQLMAERGESLILAVNLSARQFSDNDLVETIANILHETEYPAELLELEITESLLMENMDDVASTLEILSNQGIRISMDDFGTGYSSLSYLKRFPINTLKVDRSFVQDLEDDVNNASIVTATIQMAHSLNIDIVAEGVETEGQLKFLANKKCDKIQGYYFSRPLESQALRELLDENRKIEMEQGSIRLISGFN